MISKETERLGIKGFVDFLIYARSATTTAHAASAFMARFGQNLGELNPVSAAGITVEQEVGGADRLYLFAGRGFGRAHAEQYLPTICLGESLGLVLQNLLRRSRFCPRVDF